MATNSEYRERATGSSKKPIAKKTKTVSTPGTKVSAATIQNIKSMGMAKTLEALKSIGQPGSRNVPASKEFIEGARRMYGSRVDKYLPAKTTSADAARSGSKSTGPKYKSADAARSGAKTTSSKPVTKSADAARASATKTSSKSSKPMSKKSGTTDPFAKFAFAVGRAAKEPFTSKNKKTK